MACTADVERDGVGADIGIGGIDRLPQAAMGRIARSVIYVIGRVDGERGLGGQGSEAEKKVTSPT